MNIILIPDDYNVYEIAIPLTILTKTISPAPHLIAVDANFLHDPQNILEDIEEIKGLTKQAGSDLSKDKVRFYLVGVSPFDELEAVDLISFAKNNRSKIKLWLSGSHWGPHELEIMHALDIPFVHARTDESIMDLLKGMNYYIPEEMGKIHQALSSQNFSAHPRAFRFHQAWQAAIKLNRVNPDPIMSEAEENFLLITLASGVMGFVSGIEQGWIEALLSSSDN